jgi:hypothetical protein
MSYGKYFNKGQKVFIKRIFADEEQIALDTITGYAMHSKPMQLDLALPYGCDAADSYPFEPGMQFEVWWPLLLNASAVRISVCSSRATWNSFPDASIVALT